MSLRLNKQENNENTFYVTGNTPDLGDFKILKPMNMVRKKSILSIDESYWEKSILVPNDFPVDLVYNFFELDKEKHCILVNETNFSVNIFEDFKFSSFEKLWSPQLSADKKKASHFKQMTISPLKIKKENTRRRITILKNKPKRVEKKYGSVHVFNELKELSSFIKEINKDLIIGKNINSLYLFFNYL